MFYLYIRYSHIPNRDMGLEVLFKTHTAFHLIQINCYSLTIFSVLSIIPPSRLRISHTFW